MTTDIANNNKGSTLTYQTSGSFYAQMATEVTLIGVPEIQFGVATATNQTSGGWTEYISSGKKSLPEFSATANFLEADYAIASGSASAGIRSNYKINFVDSGSTVMDFKALITKLKINDIDTDNPAVMTATITFQPSGSVVIS